MYLSTMEFLGIGTQQGQKKLGLVDSPSKALELIPPYWPIQSRALFIENAPSKLIHRAQELDQLNWSIYLRAFKHIRKNLSEGKIQFNWGGDHSIGVATVAAFASLYSNGYVLWIDAHADLNTPESSPTGNFHGMPMSFLLGIGERPKDLASSLWGVLDPKRLIYFGLRDLDPYEKYLIQKLGITSYYCEDIYSSQFLPILNELSRLLANRPLHISFDIDSVDPKVAPSTGVTSPRGLTVEHLQALASHLGMNNHIKSVDIVEINPEIGTQAEVISTYAVAFNFLEKVFNFRKERVHDSTSQPNQKYLQIQSKWNTPFWP